jgi:hypothetical protein
MSWNELGRDLSIVAQVISPVIAVCLYIGLYVAPQIIEGNPTMFISAVGDGFISVAVMVVLIDRFRRDAVEFGWAAHQDEFIKNFVAKK